MPILQFSAPERAVINLKVVGVGGAGCHVINRLIESGFDASRCIAIDTFSHVDHHSFAEKNIRIGTRTTGGQGAGGNPQIGFESAKENEDEIEDALSGSDIVFITAGMGGGTGTGAASVIADIAKKKGALTIGIVSKPFGFEGRKRLRLAEQGIERLEDVLDSLVIVPNNKLLSVSDRTTTMVDAFKKADDVLKNGVEAIVSIITEVGDINIDFADVRTVMCNRGTAHIGVGSACGEGAVSRALKSAVDSPLLETSIKGAKAVLLSVSGGEQLSLLEVSNAASSVCEEVDPGAIIIFGTNIKKELGDAVTVTIVAAGFDKTTAEKDVLLSNSKSDTNFPVPKFLEK